MLVDPIETVMHENVMPWMIDRLINFIEDDSFIEYNVGEVVVDGFNSAKNKHSLAIQKEQQRKIDLEKAEE